MKIGGFGKNIKLGGGGGGGGGGGVGVGGIEGKVSNLLQTVVSIALEITLKMH